VRSLDSRVEGLEHVPASGPTILVARHVHHLFDGSIVVIRFPRPTHIVVGLDWAGDARERAGMEWACRTAEYPIVLRTPTLGARAGFGKDEQLRYMRAALRETTRLLRDGRQLLVFPEGYPNVDPVFSQKRNDDEMLPFEAGFVRFAEAAERAGAAPVALVPVGIAYDRGKRWKGVARCGAPYTLRDRPDRASLVAALEADVRRLSGLA
jgi:putative membrane protein